MTGTGTQPENPNSAESYDARYTVACDPALLRAEERAIGTHFGASSFTTLEQADRLAGILQLGPGKLLLDVGAGAGWPGVYLAGATGCSVVSSDLTAEGPRLSADWIRRDRVDGAALTASGTDLPFRDNSVDSVTCSDVFC